MPSNIFDSGTTSWKIANGKVVAHVVDDLGEDLTEEQDVTNVEIQMGNTLESRIRDLEAQVTQLQAQMKKVAMILSQMKEGKNDL